MAMVQVAKTDANQSRQYEQAKQFLPPVTYSSGG